MEVQEETTAQAPVFTSSPKSVDVREGQKAHFEARIIPVSDPTLRIEWFFNGQPIKQGSRFREGHDFGFVSLDISHVLPEDAGQWDVLPPITVPMLRDAIRSFPLRTAAGQTRLSPRTLEVLSDEA